MLLTAVPNCDAHVRIGLIVRCIRNSSETCLSEMLTYFLAGHQNELLRTNLQTEYTNGLDKEWASCVATNVMLMRKIECSN